MDVRMARIQDFLTATFLRDRPPTAQRPSDRLHLHELLSFVILLSVNCLNRPWAVRIPVVLQPFDFHRLLLVDLNYTFLRHKFEFVVAGTPRPAWGCEFSNADQGTAVDGGGVPSRGDGFIIAHLWRLGYAGYRRHGGDGRF